MTTPIQGGAAAPVYITNASDISGGGGGASGNVVVTSSALPTGAATSALQTSAATLQGAVNETAPANDTASSGLNGRLQRIAQRLTSLIALLPASLGAKTSTASLSVTLASDQTLPAGENLVGKVGGTTTFIVPTCTVSTSPAYSSGDSIGGKLTLSNALRVSGNTAFLKDILICDRANQKPTGTILIFSLDPTSATLTDNAAVVLSTNDQSVYTMVTVSASDYVTINSKAFANIAVNKGTKAISGTTLYAAFVTTSTPTFAATTDLQIIFSFIQD